MSIISGLYDDLWLGALLMNIQRFVFIAICTFIIFAKLFSDNQLNIYLKFVTSFMTVLAFVVLNRFLFGLYIFPNFYKSDYTFEILNIGNIISHSIIFLSSIAGFGLIKYYSETKEREKINQALEEQKREAELNYLKAQLHPHFLFNSLNSIYNEVLKKSDLAADLLLRVSDMLRFILYECQEDKITLDKELKLLDDYIELEKVRYGSRISIKKNFESNLNSKAKIPPLILFALVENCFKHGVSDTTEDSFVILTLSANGNFMEFSTENSINQNHKPEKEYQKGIGLKNIESQLKLIFGDNFNLKTNKNSSTFNSYLKIPLDE
jgi:LytS/YehU family sensor histidine kinase